jgi:hypothetical protein
MRHGYGRMNREYQAASEEGGDQEVEGQGEALAYSYEGQWSNDKMGDGPGELRIWKVEETAGLNIGSKHKLISTVEKVHLHYKGSFKDGKFDQDGNLTTRDSHFEGIFKEGLRHGQGKVVKF